MDTLKYNWKVLYMMTTRTIHAFLTGAALARQSSFYCPRLTFYCPKKLRHKATESVATQQAFGCSIASILRSTVQTFVSRRRCLLPDHALGLELLLSAPSTMASTVCSPCSMHIMASGSHPCRDGWTPPP